MKKRTAALTLVLIGPTLIAGCSSRDDCDPQKENCDNRSGYRGGGYGGGSSYRGRSGGSSAGESGGFGSIGRGFFRGS